MVSLFPPRPAAWKIRNAFFLPDSLLDHVRDLQGPAIVYRELEALADILESIEELKYYREHFIKLD